MVFDVSKITGLGPYTEKSEVVKSDENSYSRTVYFKHEKAFLVLNPHTIEIRCDAKLAELLRSQYESVMESRYFGHGGIEIVPAGQLTDEELYDLIRLSYNITEPIV